MYNPSKLNMFLSLAHQVFCTVLKLFTGYDNNLKCHLSVTDPSLGCKYLATWHRRRINIISWFHTKTWTINPAIWYCIIDVFLCTLALLISQFLLYVLNLLPPLSLFTSLSIIYSAWMLDFSQTYECGPNIVPSVEIKLSTWHISHVCNYLAKLLNTAAFLTRDIFAMSSRYVWKRDICIISLCKMDQYIHHVSIYHLE